MKITRTRIAARRIIVLRTICYVLLPFSIVGLIDFFWKIKPMVYMPTWLIYTILFSQPVIAGLVVFYRLHKNHDGKLLKKWQEKDERWHSERKSKKHQVIEHIQDEGYLIENIIPKRKQAFLFEITFSREIIKRAKPEVTLNGVRLSIEVTGSKTIICHAIKAINTDLQELIFWSGVFKYNMPNPYYIKGNIPLNAIMWQCEGHSFEKNIFLDGKYFPNANQDVIYPFLLFINDRKIGEFTGLYIPENDYIALNIGSIKKDSCVGKRCFIRPTFGKEKIYLPRPSILSLNNSLQKEVVF